MRLNWTANADAIGYGIYNVTSGTPVFLTTVNGQASSSYTASGLSSATLYAFRVRVMDSSSKFDNNTTALSATTTGAASAPTALTLVSPSSSPDVSDTPTVRVAGVKNGDNVKLYSDSCTTQVATGVASGVTIDLTSSSLAVGSYNFYAKSGSSVCSTATLAYTRTACAAGYTLVSGVCRLSFAGLTSITNVTDTSATLNWTSHASASYYIVYKVVGGVLTSVATLSAPASTTTLTGLTTNTAYTFRVRAFDASGVTETNTSDQSTTTLSTTPAPSALTLITPSTASDYLDTPTVRVAGVKSGDSVKLYSDNCATQVAVATATGATIDLTSSALLAGSYNFYAKSGSSACSTATLAYTRVACAGGYILSGGICVLSFAGITSITNVTDTTLTLNWPNHTSAAYYKISRMIAGVPTFVTAVNAPASSVNLTGLTPNTSYTFRVRAYDATETSETNAAVQTTTTNLAPDVPSALALQSPNYTPAMTATLTVRISGVKNGDTIKLFTNNTCTTQVASGVASGTTIDLTATSLAVGATTLYANATNSLSNASACSSTVSASVTFTRFLCPTNYLTVVHNTAVGTNTDFCVMKYDAKCVGAACPLPSGSAPGVNATATSTMAGTPWVSITQTNAILACSNLGAGYALISNPEWMTIARDVEQVATNWSNGGAGSGVLARGHTDNNPGNALAASTDDDPYNGTGNNSGQAANSGWEQRRTLNLSNGGVIWDFAGNVWQWVNWQVTPANKAYVSADGSPQGAWRNFSALNMKITSSDEMKPETWQSYFTTLTGNEGIGQYYAGNNSSGGAALRGGAWGNTTSAGAFALHLDASSGFSNTSIGFRCVFHP